MSSREPGVPAGGENKFKQLRVSAWDERNSMEAKLVGKVILFNFIPPPPIIDIIYNVAYQNLRLIRPFPQCHLPKLKHISAEALP